MKGHNMQQASHRRHDISDKVWEKLEPHLPGRTGVPWMDLPPDYGNWNNVNRRFCRWIDKGTWEGLLDMLIEDPDYEWLIIDASHCKVHPHASGAKGGNQDMSRTKGGSIPRYIWPWMRMVCQLESLSLKVPGLIAQRLQA